MGKVDLTEVLNHPSFLEGARLLHQTNGTALYFYDKDEGAEHYLVGGQCEFCRLVRNVHENCRKCVESDRQAAERSLRTGARVSYRCHAGLMKVVLPVIVSNERIGCFYSGHLLPSPPREDDRNAIREIALELGIDPDRLYQAFCRVPVADTGKMDLALGLLRVICDHVVHGESAVRRERKQTLEQRELRKAAEEKANLERHLREMELRLVSAQLNPHFLFNGLNLIMGFAMKENARETMRLVDGLATFLRMSLTRIGSMVTLEEEVRSARAYVEMFQARFSRQVDLQVSVPRRLAGFRVPALILQPLVENALVHGLPGCADTFRLTISAGFVGDAAEITVQDNGGGLSAAQISKICWDLQRTEPGKKTTGLSGLDWRLRYYYSGRAGLRLDKTDDGLKVVISVPQRSAQIRRRSTRRSAVAPDCVCA